MATSKERIEEIIKAEGSLGHLLTEEEQIERVKRFRETLSQIPGFDSLTDEQEERALEFALILKHKLIFESLSGQSLSGLHSSGGSGIEKGTNLALETAKEIGIDLTQKVVEAAVEAAEKTLVLKKFK